MRVIIIGSGIGGLSAAIALRKVGAEVSVYERAPELREVGAGISVWANAMRALDHLGAGESVRAASERLVRTELRVRSGHRTVLALAAADVERRYAWPELVRLAHRADLVAALAAHLPAGTARYGHECVSVRGHATAAEVAFANGHRDEADVVLGADGIHSVVRASLFGPQPPRYSGYTCWRGVCPRPAALAPGSAFEWWGRGQRLGGVALPGDRVYWYAAKNAPPDGRAGDERALLLETFRGWADPAAELFSGTAPERVLRNDIIDRPPTAVWSQGRVGLLGDAAHPTTPNLGQGGCLAIEDAVAVARHLARAADPAAALAAFAAERAPRAAAVVRESWRLGAIAHKEGRLTCWLRDAALRAVSPLLGSDGFVKHARYDVGPLPR